MLDLDEEILKLACVDGEGASDTSTESSDESSTDASTQENTSTETNEEIPTEDVPEEVEIDGEKISYDDIRKFKNGYNSYAKTLNDYKELSDRSKDAIELYNYIKGNKELAQKLYEFDEELNNGGSKLDDKMPSKEKEEISNLKREINTMKIENQLNVLKAKDSSMDELQVLKIATEKNLDLETAYKVYKADNFDKELQAKLKEQSKKTTKELKDASSKTKTLITEGEQGSADVNYGLSDTELLFAKKLGMEPKEYSKWKTYKR